MYTLPTSNYLRRSLFVNNHMAKMTSVKKSLSHEESVKQELIEAGLNKLDLMSSEAEYLHKIIHTQEHIGGAVFGRGPDGYAILVATNLRVIYYDKKPLFTNKDEVTYFVVSGVKFEHAGLGSTLTLHTKVKDYRLRIFNKKAGKNFVKFIEARSLERTNGSQQGVMQ